MNTSLQSLWNTTSIEGSGGEGRDDQEYMVQMVN